MLNRRHIRIKVLQAFYAFFQSNNEDVLKGEKELFHSIEKIYDLYVFILMLFPSLKRQALIQIEEAKRSEYLRQDIHILKTGFIDNQLVDLIEQSKVLQKISKDRKINWEGDVENDLTKKIFKEVYQTDNYKNLLQSESTSFNDDKNALVQLYKKEICNLEKLHHFFDEKSIYWQDDLDHVSSMILKTLKSITEDQELEILPLWKEDEYEFTQNLFRKAVLQKEENDALLQTYSKNWEKERLATMDSLLMNLAMTEALEFSSIPIKVTLNEYIEISKFYSTPKSNSFINGILDRIFEDYKKDGKLVKRGRGLIN
ncbi:MAG: transcription antitermination factor NusB [Bacteroidota bacterium]|nr:transcription antitermination factor NusB [Bacteroidota bacterium]MEC8286259.1 transcription antitermination factor NusB [Bacteroidota bacterium]